jgi:hypothetical protein
MNNLWEGFLAALVLAGISAVTFIAYKHPSGYRRLYWPLFSAIMIPWILWTAFSIGQHFGFSDALIQLYSMNPDLAFHPPTQEPDPPWTHFVPAVIVAYLFFLDRLPLLLADASRKEEPQGQGQKTDPNPPAPEQMADGFANSKKKRNY